MRTNAETTTPPPGQPQSDLEPIPPPPEEMQDRDDANDDTEMEEEDDRDKNEEEEDKDKDVPEEELDIPEEFMLGASAANIDPKLMQFNKWTRRGKGGKRSRIFNLERGRFVKPIFPKGDRIGKLAVGATLRAAAPYQRLRRARAISAQTERQARIHHER